MFELKKHFKTDYVKILSVFTSYLCTWCCCYYCTVVWLYSKMWIIFIS